MWSPVEIRFSHLFSHTNSVFKFKHNQMVLLLGKMDGTEEGADSNGVGKSVIIDALTIAVTGIIPRELTKESIVQWGESSAVIEFLLQHSVTLEIFAINREIFAGSKSSILDILENEKRVTGFDKMKRTAQQYIYEKLGITEEDFLNYYVINQEQLSSFITSTDGKQKQVISRFSNYNMVEPVIEKIKLAITNLEGEEQQLEATRQAKQILLDSIQENIEQIENSDDFATRKNAVIEKIAVKQRIIEITQENIFSLEIDRDRLKNDFARLKTGPKEKLTLVQLQAKYDEIKAAKAELDEELDELRIVQSQLTIKNGKLIKCPNCKWEFLANDNMTKEELVASNEFVATEIEKLQIQYNEYSAQLPVIKQRIAVLEQQEALLGKIKTKQERINGYAETKQGYVDELQQLQLDLKNIKKDNNKQLINAQKEKLKVVNTALYLAKFQLEELAKKKGELNFHKFAFEKQFRTYIANKTIRTIQDLINFYLQKFKINFRVLINGYKLLKNGEVREKIQVWILKNGTRQVLIKAMSGGQKARASVCAVLALHTLINNASSTGGLSLLCMDEFLSALDVTGQNEVIKMLEQSKLTSVLVMHHAGDAQAKNKVTVYMKNEISEIVQ